MPNIAQDTLPTRKDRLATLIRLGVMPSIAEEALAWADARGQTVPTPDEVAGLPEPDYAADIAQARQWWLFADAVPMQFKRLLAAQQVEGAKFNPYHDELGRFAEGPVIQVSNDASVYTQEQVLNHILATNPPEQIKAGRMTPDEWADRYMSAEPDGFVAVNVHPRALNLPIEAGDPEKVQHFTATDGKDAPAIVVDSNDKIEARYGGGRLDQAYGLQPHTVLDGKHRVEAALARGDQTIPAIVPTRKAERILQDSHAWEVEEYAVSYFSRKGYTVIGRQDRGWLVNDPVRGDRPFTNYDMVRIARNLGHSWRYDSVLPKFNPYHDELGRFAEAGGGGFWKDAAGKKSKRQQIDDFVQLNGFQESIIAYNGRDKAIDGHPVLAELDRRTSKVVIYPSGLKAKNIKSILVHELMHTKTEKLETSALAKRIKAIVGQDAWADSAWHSIKGDQKVSDYSDWHWQRSGGFHAVKETLSEVARLDYEGRFGDVPENWQKLYLSVME